ncbi:MAG: DNA repair protein RadC [candidate division WOR-3 bacterium]|nr:DNA repair protein RadC [candidate division WOR-3 bacterium]
MRDSKNKNEGHRKRVREKFIKSGISSFNDYEIVELLLTLGTPRKDCKQQAKEAIKKFKTLRGVLEAPMEEIQEIKGIGPHNSFGIKLFQEISERYLKEKIVGEEIQLKSSKAVFDYLYQSMQKNKKEIFRVMFLDGKNKLIEVEDLFEGSLTSSAVYPREIMKKAIKYDAVSLIFVHNHPSGNPEPSQSDQDITENLVFTGNLMEIKVLDHIIIGDNKYYSFADEGLIEEYNLNFLNMKGGDV